MQLHTELKREETIADFGFGRFFCFFLFLFPFNVTKVINDTFMTTQHTVANG